MRPTERWVSAPLECPTPLQRILGQLLDLGDVVVRGSRMYWRSSVLARRASSGVAIACLARRASSRCRPTSESQQRRPACCAMAGWTAARAPRRPALCCIRSSSISRAARGVGGAESSRSDTSTPRCVGDGLSSDSRGSRRPFSISESWLPAMPTATPSWSRVSPASVAEMADALAQGREIGHGIEISERIARSF